MFHPHFELVPLVRAVGYPGVALIVFAESGLFFGFFLPGASMLFTAGLLASTGLFDPWVLIPLVALAAILGDSTGYWFGRKVGVRLFLKPDSRLFKHEHLERAKAFYDAHGVYAVILARFMPIVRTFAPILAGIVRMKYRTFFAYNVTGALLWASGITALGYYLGARFPIVQTFIGPIILLIIVATTAPLVWQLRRPRA